MNDSVTECIKFQVPVNTGYLIGNTLRQFAMRGGCTWQPAAYKINEKTGTFGLSGGYNFSVLEFSRGRLISTAGAGSVVEKLCQFELQGDDYIYDDMVIKNLGNLRAPVLDVCLVYAGGSRTKEQNYSVVKRLCPLDADSYFTVSSRHTPTIDFKFKVEPKDLHSEMLEIKATPGAVALARDSAVQSLAGLHI